MGVGDIKFYSSEENTVRIFLHTKSIGKTLQNEQSSEAEPHYLLGR